MNDLKSSAFDYIVFHAFSVAVEQQDKNRGQHPAPGRIQPGLLSYQVDAGFHWVSSYLGVFLVEQKTRLDQGPPRSGLLTPATKPLLQIK